MKKNYIISFNREKWLSLAVQRIALVAVLCTLLAIILNFFDHSESLTWIIAGVSVAACTGAFFLLNTEYFPAKLVAFGMSMGMANYVGSLLPFENGLVFIYPLLLCTFILTQNKRSELIVLSIVGFASFVCYMLISIENTIVTANEPNNALQFFTTSICLGTISL